MDAIGLYIRRTEKYKINIYMYMIQDEPRLIKKDRNRYIKWYGGALMKTDLIRNCRDMTVHEVRWQGIE